MTSSRQISVTIYAPNVAAFFNTIGLDHVGGAEAQVMLIADMLTHLGYRVRVLTINAGDRGDARGLQVKIAWRSGQLLPVKVAGLFRRVVSARGPLYLRASRPSLDNAAVVGIGRLLGRRVVVGLASDLMVAPNRAGSLGWVTSMVILKGATKVIAQTEKQRALVSSRYGSRSVVISNFVDVSRFNVAYAPGFHDRNVDVLWVGSLVPVKGLDTVAELAERLLETKFAVVGGLPRGSDEALGSATERLRRLPNVIVAGFVHPANMPAWYGRAKVLLHTATPVRAGYLKEGFPNVFLEAWASGIPVISTAADPDLLVSRRQLGVLCSGASDLTGVIMRTTRDEREWLPFRDRVRAYAEGRASSRAECRQELVLALFGRMPAVSTST